MRRPLLRREHRTTVAGGTDTHLEPGPALVESRTQCHGLPQHNLLTTITSESTYKLLVNYFSWHCPAYRESWQNANRRINSNTDCEFSTSYKIHTTLREMDGSRILATQIHTPCHETSQESAYVQTARLPTSPPAARTVAIQSP